MPCESSRWKINAFSIAHRSHASRSAFGLREWSGPIAGQAFQHFLDVRKGFVDAQLTLDEDLDSVLMRVYLLSQGIYPLGQGSHRIGHEDLRRKQLLLRREQTFVAANQAFDRTLNAIDSAHIAMAVGFFYYSPSLSSGE
jgi:hypothetical protein